MHDLNGEFQNMVKVVDQKRRKEKKKIFVILIDGVG